MGGRTARNWDSAKDFDQFYQFFSDEKNPYHKYWKDIPWGVGAWGTYEKSFSGTEALTTDDRITYVNHLVDALNNPKKYPKIKASIWYDNLMSTIIEKKEDLERDDQFRKNYPQLSGSPEMAPTMKKYF